MAVWTGFLETFGMKQVGAGHQADLDTLVTSRVFQKISSEYLDNNDDVVAMLEDVVQGLDFRYAWQNCSFPDFGLGMCRNSCS